MAPPIKPGVRVTVRVHRDEHLKHYRQEAQRRGVSLSDYLGSQLAAAHNFTTDNNEAAPPQLPLGTPWRRDGLSVTDRLRGLLNYWEHHPEIRDEVRQRALTIMAEEAHDVA